MEPSNKHHCRLHTESVTEPHRRQYFKDNNSLVDSIKINFEKYVVSMRPGQRRSTAVNRLLASYAP